MMSTSSGSSSGRSRGFLPSTVTCDPEPGEDLSKLHGDRAATDDGQ